MRPSPTDCFQRCLQTETMQNGGNGRLSTILSHNNPVLDVIIHESLGRDCVKSSIQTVSSSHILSGLVHRVLSFQFSACVQVRTAEWRRCKNGLKMTLLSDMVTPAEAGTVWYCQQKGEWVGDWDQGSRGWNNSNSADGRHVLSVCSKGAGHLVTCMVTSNTVIASHGVCACNSFWALWVLVGRDSMSQNEKGGICTM